VIVVPGVTVRSTGVKKLLPTATALPPPVEGLLGPLDPPQPAAIMPMPMPASNVLPRIRILHAIGMSIEGTSIHN
jgi:hypothetical protein